MRYCTTRNNERRINSLTFFIFFFPFFLPPENNRTGYWKHVKQYYGDKAPQSVAAIPFGHEKADGVDGRGKVVVVTGANSGLGKEVATYAAAKGARVYMLCRNEERANKARDDIIQRIKEYKVDATDIPKDDDLRIILVDTSELEQVRTAVKDLQSKESKIHALVCNAGALLDERRETSEGNEVTFAGHLLGGTYLLGKLLVPQLEAAKGRCVIVTSGGMYNFKLPSWDVLTNAPDCGAEYNGTNAYAYAKRGQVLLAERWTKEFPSVQWVTVHPGWAQTPGVDVALKDTKQYLKPLRNSWEGAEGAAWLAFADADEVKSGELYLDRKIQQKHLAGAFFSEGSYTKNTEEEVDEFMENLKKAAGL